MKELYLLLYYFSSTEPKPTPLIYGKVLTVVIVEPTSFKSPIFAEDFTPVSATPNKVKPKSKIKSLHIVYIHFS